MAQSLRNGSSSARPPARDRVMFRDPTASVQNLRVILEKVLREAAASDLPVIVTLMEAALAAIPDEDR